MQTLNVTVRGMYKRLPFADACELHERLQQGKADKYTRSLLRGALRRTGLHRGLGQG